MTAAVRSGIVRGKDLTLPNKNGVTPVSIIDRGYSPAIRAWYDNVIEHDRN